MKGLEFRGFRGSGLGQGCDISSIESFFQIQLGFSCARRSK